MAVLCTTVLLMGNSVSRHGGGAYGGALYNCILTENSAYGAGGGTRDATLYNCTLTENSALYGFGGGALFGALYNCTLTDNIAHYGGGGAFDATLDNCIIYYNIAPEEANYSGGTFNFCCTTPGPVGTGNITNEPMFVDRAVDNLRLSSNSPCINTGTNQDWMIGATDLDGHPRIYGGGRVDRGAYEYQGSLSVIPTNWLARYGLPIDGSEDRGQADGDGMDNWQEWRCNTDPTNETSFLHFTTFALEGTGLVVRWQSAEGVRYRLKRSTNLCSDAFSYSVRTNIPAVPPLNTETDTTAAGSGPWFYRVGVE